MAREAAEQLKNLGLDIDPRARLGDFPIGVQQLVELARVLFSGARIIILDEPTSALVAAGDRAAVRRSAAGARERARASSSSRIFSTTFSKSRTRSPSSATAARSRMPRSARAIDKAWIIERHDRRRSRGARGELSRTTSRSTAARDAPVVLEAEGLTLAPYFRDVSFAGPCRRSARHLRLHGLRPDRTGAHVVRQAARRTRGGCELDGAVTRLKHTTARQERRHRLCAGEPAHDAVSRGADLPATSPSPSSSCSRKLVRAPRSRARGRAPSTRSARRPPAGRRGAARRPVGRQPAEGRARQMADAPAQGAAAGRADARHGRRRQGGRRPDRQAPRRDRASR